MKDTEEKVVKDLLDTSHRFFVKDFTTVMAIKYSVLDSYEFGFARGVIEAIKFMNRGENNGK